LENGGHESLSLRRVRAFPGLTTRALHGIQGENIMMRLNRFAAIALSMTLCAGILSAPLAARASEEGQRNTALGLGAAAAALLLTQKNKLPGIVAAAGAAYAYKRYDDSVRNRHRFEREYGYGYDRYNRDRYRQHDDDYYDNQDRYRNNDTYNDGGYYGDNGNFPNDYRNGDRYNGNMLDSRAAHRRHYQQMPVGRAR
jgi:hypothetical protein